MTRACRAAVVVLLVVLMLGQLPEAALAQAGKSTLPQEIAKLLELGWSAATRSEAKTQFERLQHWAPGDRRVAYAYALVQIKQLHYAEAAEWLGKALGSPKQNLPAWETQIWLLARDKQFDVAMVEMEALGRRLPAEDAEGEAETENQEAARFLGALVGYLTGPAAADVNASRLAASQRRVVARLTSTRRAAFDEGLNGVVQRHRQLLGEADGMRIEAVETGTRKKEDLMRALQEEEQRAAAQLEAAEAEQRETEKRLDYERQEVLAKGREISSAIGQSQRRLTDFRREAAGIDQRIRELYAVAEHPDTEPHRRHYLLAEAARWEVHLRRAVIEADQAMALLVRLNNELAALEGRNREILAALREEAKRVDAVRRILKRIHFDQGKAGREQVTGSTPLVRSRSTLAGALATYLPMPLSLEVAKKRLLESLR